jgi:hypothetical protein
MLNFNKICREAIKLHVTHFVRIMHKGQRLIREKQGIKTSADVLQWTLLSTDTSLRTAVRHQPEAFSNR